MNQFHGDETCVVHVSQLVNGDDIGVIERGWRNGLPFQSASRLPLEKGVQGKCLDGHFTVQAGVSGAINLAHAAGAQLFEGFRIPKRVPGDKVDETESGVCGRPMNLVGAAAG